MVDTKPTTVADYMLFTGTQNVRFSDKDIWHMTSPYSVEMDVYIEDLLALRYIGTVGEGFGLGWPEWTIWHDGTTIGWQTSSTNNGVTTQATFVSGVNAKQWYRLGFMYLNGRVYGFVNGTKVFDIAIDPPINSTNGLAFGGDYRKYASRQFKGRIRNITMGQSAFWSV